MITQWFNQYHKNADYKSKNAAPLNYKNSLNFRHSFKIKANYNAFWNTILYLEYEYRNKK